MCASVVGFGNVWLIRLPSPLFLSIFSDLSISHTYDVYVRYIPIHVLCFSTFLLYAYCILYLFHIMCSFFLSSRSDDAFHNDWAMMSRRITATIHNIITHIYVYCQPWLRWWLPIYIYIYRMRWRSHPWTLTRIYVYLKIIINRFSSREETLRELFTHNAHRYYIILYVFLCYRENWPKKNKSREISSMVNMSKYRNSQNCKIVRLSVMSYFINIEIYITDT